MIPKIEVTPSDRLKPMQEQFRNKENQDPGPCGGFTSMYACMCDLHNLPFMEDVAWVSISHLQETIWCRRKRCKHINGDDLRNMKFIVNFKKEQTDSNLVNGIITCMKMVLCTCMKTLFLL